jgi:hypothetical protein
MQDGAAGHQDFQPRASVQQFNQLRGCRHHLLKIIQQQEHLFLSQRGYDTFHNWLISCFPQSKGLGNSWQDQIWIADRGQRDEADALCEVI